MVCKPNITTNHAITYTNLPDVQVKFFEEFKLRQNCEINSAHQNVFGAS